MMTEHQTRYWQRKLVRAISRLDRREPGFEAAHKILNLCRKEVRQGYLSEEQRDERTNLTGKPWRK